MPANQSVNRGRAGKQGKPTPTDWARIWFDKLAKFHQINDPQRWAFSDQDVIALLRYKLKQGVPAWKRLKIVQALIHYRNHVLQSKSPRLEPIRAKLQELV